MFVSERGARLRANKLVVAASASPLLGAVGLLTAFLVTRFPPVLALLPHLLILGTALPLAAWAARWKAREDEGKVEVDDRGVSHKGELIVPRDTIRDAFLLPRAGKKPVVRVYKRGLHRTENFRVEDREEGRAMLRALGRDASQSVAEFRVPSRLLAEEKWRTGIILGFGVSVAVLVGLTAVLSVMLRVPIPVALLVIPLGITMAVLFSIPTKLRVGSDGLHLKWFRYNRFLSYRDIAEITPFEEEGIGNQKMRGIDFRMRSGELVRVPIQPKNQRGTDQLEIVYERIAEAIDTWRRGDAGADSSIYRRGSREVTQWIVSMKQIGTGANADNRRAPVLPDTLWRIVEDPSAPPDARAGAAVALAAGGEDDHRVRLRAAAETTALPKLRFAIEQAAAGADEAALSEALREMESEAEQTAKR